VAEVEAPLRVPRDLAVLLVRSDPHGDVVLSEFRVVVERFSVHVHDERVTHAAHRLASGGLEHPGTVNRDVSVRVAQEREDG
jgi:hypothetical protein